MTRYRSFRQEQSAPPSSPSYPTFEAGKAACRGMGGRYRRGVVFVVRRAGQRLLLYLRRVGRELVGTPLIGVGTWAKGEAERPDAYTEHELEILGFRGSEPPGLYLVEGEVDVTWRIENEAGDVALLDEYVRAGSRPAQWTDLRACGVLDPHMT